MTALDGVLAWLDDAGIAGPAPARAAELVAAPAAGSAAEWRDYAAGRLYLIEGDAGRAGGLLVPLAARYPGRPGWTYHAAWARLLVGDRGGVIGRFAAVRDRPDGWAVGCLALDADPDEAARKEINWLLRAAGGPEYGDVVRARLALAGTGPPPAEPAWRPGLGGGCLAEELEALRTVMGLRCAHGRTAAAAEALASPLFQRLPLAERLLWSGVAALRADQERGRGHLVEAAGLGYDRAALVLAVHDLGAGRADDPARRLERLAPWTGRKIEAVRAWADRRHGRATAALHRLRPLVPPASQPSLTSRTAVALRVAEAAEAVEAAEVDRALDLLLAVLDELPAGDGAALDDLARLMRPAVTVPALCGRLLRRRRAGRSVPAAPPALTGLVRRLACDVGSAAGSPAPLTQARCAVAVGDHETADLAWARALDGDAAGPIAEEYARYLCHRVAVNPPGDPVETARIVRRAAGVLGRSDLEKVADALELDGCVRRLLAHLDAGDRQRSGRLRVLEDAVLSDPELRRALLDGDQEAVGPAWSAHLAGERDGVSIKHALAVLHRERALSLLAAGGENAGGRDAGDGASGDESLATATLAWVELAGMEKFLSRFGDDVAAIAADLLALHARLGRQALAAGRPERARVHLLALDTCRRPGGRSPEIARVAEAHVDDWCSEVIQAATESVDDAKLVERLPEMIAKAYGAGIDRLRTFLDLGVPHPRVLRVGLDWHNDWCYGCYLRDEVDEMSKVLVSAGRFADLLVAQSTPGAAYEQENEALGRYFHFRAYASRDGARAARSYAESLRWDPANARVVEFMARHDLARARELADRGEFAAARKLAEKARGGIPGDTEIADFLAALDGREAGYRDAVAIHNAVRLVAGTGDLAKSSPPERLASGDAGDDQSAHRLAIFETRRAEVAVEAADYEVADDSFARAYEASPYASGREQIARRWAAAHLTHVTMLLADAAGSGPGTYGPPLAEALREGRRLLEMAVVLDPASRLPAARILSHIERLEEGRR